MTARIRINCSHGCRRRRRGRAAAGCASSSARPPASARPTPCSRRRSPPRRRGPTSWSATSSRTAAARPSACSRRWNACRRRPVQYRGMVRQEFDLDAALRRRPEILLVDELAHSNLVEGEPPPRHAKRWQDINELLRCGHQRLDDAQHPAPRKPQRPDRADHRRPPARDDPGPRARRGGRDRTDRPAAGRPAAAAEAGQGLPVRTGRHGRRALLPQVEPDRAARTRAAQDGGSGRRRGARTRPARLAVARLSRPRSRARGHRPGRAGRAARAHRQADRGRARRRVDDGLRRNAGAAATLGRRAGSTNRRAASRRVAGRRHRDAGWHDGGDGAARIRAHARRNARAGRRAEAAWLAGAVPALHRHRTREARTGAST